MSDVEKFKMSRYIVKLPNSLYPWRISSFEGKIYLVNQEHEPYVIIDEFTMKKLEFGNDG